jgi:hypothetical protein
MAQIRADRFARSAIIRVIRGESETSEFLTTDFTDG